jgi:hypothetical protein
MRADFDGDLGYDGPFGEFMLAVGVIAFGLFLYKMAQEAGWPLALVLLCTSGSPLLYWLWLRIAP